MSITKSLLQFVWIICLCEGLNASNGSYIEPYEVQHAECTVTAGEVKASAEAKTTKTLKGVCGSEEMQKAFENLEAKINEQFEQLRNLILNSQQTQFAGNSPATNTISTNESNLKKHVTILPNQRARSSNRYAEIERLNKTLISDEKLKFFSYYWKIENFTHKIQMSNYSSESSPLFSIFGKTFSIDATFRYLGRDFLHLRLQILPTEQQTKNKFISLNTETENMFRDINTIVFKHKIAILNQENPSQDLLSQELINIADGFTIPNSVLMSNAYLKDDIVLIKIFLYF